MKKTIIILPLFFLNISFAQLDTVKVFMIVSDCCLVRQDNGYDVRQLRNTVQDDSSTVLCCREYWNHLYYLDENKKLISPRRLTVWNTKDTNWIQEIIIQMKNL